MAAHKFHGPKGVGGVYIARRVKVRPLLLGGHQEKDLRAGTENVAGVVGMSVALQLAAQHLDEENTRVRPMRDRLEAGLLERVPLAYVNGDTDRRLPNTSSISFESLEAEAILMLLSNEGLCASSGSACSSGSLEPSHVLQAMGIDPVIAHGAIRFSLSRFNTGDEIEQVLDIVPSVIQRLREPAPRLAEPRL
jgi:cysteine desulfurase